jgi:large subunit ribosomal protein L21
MYAILEIGGKSYRVEKGSEVLVDLMQAQEGENVKFKTVSLYKTDKEILIGQPFVEKAEVDATVVTPLVAGKKLVIFKYKQKTAYRKRNGHRQKYTKLKITNIHLAEKTASAKAEKPAKAEAESKSE